MEGVYHAWHIAQQGEHEIEPKLTAQADSKKHTERWQYSGKDYLRGTRNRGSHGALLSECGRRASGLVPRPSAGFLFAWGCKFYTTVLGCPSTAPIEGASILCQSSA